MAGSFQNHPLRTAFPAMTDAYQLEQRLMAAADENAKLRSSNQRLSAALADITRQRDDCEQHLLHDDASGLPNRRMLMQRLQEGIAESFIHQRQLSQMFIDLEVCTVVHHRQGHAAGDKLLTVLASRRLGSSEAGDPACAPCSDDSPSILTGIDKTALVFGLAEDIRRHIDGRYWISGQELQISASIGLVLGSADGEQRDTLLGSAATASHLANRAGSGRLSLAALDQQTWPTFGIDGRAGEQANHQADDQTPGDLDGLGARFNYVRYQTDASGMPL